MAAATCPHGLSQAECLICKTLQSQPQQEVASRPRPGSASAGAGGGIRGLSSLGAVPPDAIYAPETRQPRPRSLGMHFAFLIVGVAVIALVAWVVAGAVFALLHLLELILVAGVAGWAGYRLGHWRGRHHRE